MSDKLFLSVVIPVKNEQDNIGPMLMNLIPHLPERSEIIVIPYDAFDPTIRTLEYLKIEGVYWWPGHSLGVAEQLRTGFRVARGDAILVTMADLCDDPQQIPYMLWNFEFCDMVVASRYMPGGRQIGAPHIKSFLSWLAGWSLYKLGLPTHDPSNSYKLYRADKLKALGHLGGEGFDINLEIVAKALQAGWRISEVPTTWRGRIHGNSHFRFWKWLPRYAIWWVRIAWRLQSPRLL